MASPEEMAATMLANLPEKTGKALADWHEILKKTKLEKHGQLVSYLKKEHGVTHGFANLIVSKFLAAGSDGNTDLVAQQYAGGKSALRPIYDALATKIMKFGKDVEIAPKKSYVSLRRRKQFGLIQPSTKTRLDIGLNLPGVDASGRLEVSGSFNAMVTHRVRVESLQDIDADLLRWLREAYEGAN